MVLCILSVLNFLLIIAKTAQSPTSWCIRLLQVRSSTEMTWQKSLNHYKGNKAFSLLSWLTLVLVMKGKLTSTQYHDISLSRQDWHSKRARGFLQRYTSVWPGFVVNILAYTGSIAFSSTLERLGTAVYLPG